MSVTDIAIVVISILAIIIVLWVLYRPSICKGLIQKFTKGPSYPLSSNGREVDNYTIYVQGGSTNLLVWFNGGSFLFSTRSTVYGVLNQLNSRIKNCDIIVFDYPVRFSHTINDALFGCDKVLGKFAGRYKNYYAVGYSAGVVLMGTYQHKENSLKISRELGIPQTGIKFKAMICINGLYHLKLTNPLADKLFQFYIVRGTKKPNLFTAYGITDIPKLVIGAEGDFLYNQTREFLLKEPNTESYIYTNKSLTHLFPLYYNLDEARDCANRIVAFINSHIV